MSNSHVPFQLGYRPKTSVKTKRPRLFRRSLREFDLSKEILRTDKSRRPNAIDAPSHHGFDPYHHCKSECSTSFSNPQRAQISADVHRVSDESNDETAPPPIFRDANEFRENDCFKERRLNGALRTPQNQELQAKTWLRNLLFGITTAILFIYS